MKLTLITVLLGASLSAGSAQSAEGDVCGRIIDHGLNNIAIATNSESFTDRIFWRFCDEKSENISDQKALEFGATIKSIPFNLGASDSTVRQKHSKFCGDYKSLTSRTSDTALYTAKLHDRAIDAWSNCIALARTNLLIDFQVPQSQKYVDVSLKYSGPSAATFSGVETEGFKCKRSGELVTASTSFPLGPAEEHLRCERDYTSQDIAGVTSDYYGAGGVTVKTNAGRSALEFVPMVEGPARSRLDQVDVNIAGIWKTLADMSTNLSAWGGEESRATRIGAPTDGSNWGTTVCPVGHYMVGLEGWGAPGPIRFCVNCGWAMRAVCRPLNAAKKLATQ